MKITIIKDDATLEHVRLKKGDVLEVDDDLAIHWKQVGICEQYTEPSKVFAEIRTRKDRF